jgi:hypothetical protein
MGAKAVKIAAETTGTTPTNKENIIGGRDHVANSVRYAARGRALSLADAVARQVSFTSILTLTPFEAQCRSASTS